MPLPNHLIRELSPYLLQHAYNPVDWYPWGEAASAKAAAEGKLLLISIGYASCHWCHVMERESFEDEAIARFMNENFVCIKVDREERPDIDQVYMSAVQMIQGRGGWPLHAFALADGRPFFGGTYYPPDQWRQLLQQIVAVSTNKPLELEKQAEEIAAGVRVNVFAEAVARDLDLAAIDNSITSWSRAFDHNWGGQSGAPKFPVPVNFLYLLRYYKASGKKEILDFVILSLQKMGRGGIYDQLGGGFARYSTDAEWKIPHFEKMLYDNAQLVSLYTEAFQLSRLEEFRNVVYETIAFVERELTSPEACFYSALDADSEGEEGLFYTWTAAEIFANVKEDAALFCDYYFNQAEARDVLFVKLGLAEYAQIKGLDPAVLEAKFAIARGQLLAARGGRIRPALDDKSLCSWNALMSKACFEAYEVFGEKKFLQLGKANLDFLMEKCRRNDGGLWHRYKAGIAGIPGFLEDYAFLMEALLAFPAGIDNRYLYQAKTLMHISLDQFYDVEQGLCFFTAAEDEKLFARKMELIDNVIPSSNASVCRSLFRLGLIFHEDSFLKTAKSMLGLMQEKTLQHPASFSNWGIALLENLMPFYTIAIAGPEAETIKHALNQHYLPFSLKVASTVDCFLPLLQNRHEADKTVIHVCHENGCLLPTENVAEALVLLGETVGKG